MFKKKPILSLVAEIKKVTETKFNYSVYFECK